ncbi:MAG TPA: SMP-30/gluconolactonase/LRE family protein [Arenimonas sp.]|uniref:SMP-30/gluconolactonase/LRE family protein n=1 Tax=Arenimonas sp. TaxID=1872635 RepID=UPI002D7E7402|nr:SMP-30/gluconolactonase/LRE family protein [Arenimonas sp.]HEU0154315.1 SMP-30/gluconolactonase/LRE family protein [Arenimonas sp.]
MTRTPPPAARHRRKLASVAAVLTLAYFAAWPVPVAPVAWQAPEAPGYAGPHRPNQRLANLRHIDLGGDSGPEHVALGPDGRLYAAVASGRILRFAPDGSDREVFADTGGRVLGFAFDAGGQLIAADAYRGLLAISPAGETRVLLNVFEGQPIRYADAVAIARDGRIFFTDASQRFGPAARGGTFEASVLDILEQSATGRVFEYDPSRRTVRLVAQGLSFANGLVLTADERALLVVETGRYRVWRIDAAANAVDVGQPSPQARVLLDNLPGYPDNLVHGLDGRIWLGFTKPRSAAVDAMAPHPFLRQLTLRLPRALWPVPPAYGHVIAFDESGAILADLQDPSGAYPETTAVTETPARRYVQSLHAPTLGWLPAN